MTANPTPIIALLAGKAAPFRGPDEPSAIAKLPLAGPVSITPLGICGDEQTDRIHHGGPDMALHHYAFDHYAAWRSELGAHALLGQPGAFGENISTTGLTEDNVCLGDRYRLGTALVEVSKARQPCWKQGHRLSQPDMVARIVATRRCGWYDRVVEPGTAGPDDAMTLLARPLPAWTVARLFGVLIAGDHKRDAAALAELVDETLLAADWRGRARALQGE